MIIIENCRHCSNEYVGFFHFKLLVGYWDKCVNKYLLRFTDKFNNEVSYLLNDEKQWVYCFIDDCFIVEAINISNVKLLFNTTKQFDLRR